ncbi:MAG: GspH/FimT family pseudopilin, partial [Gemmatimonadota bacterium]|nr:GspH/FimT family pseudopilin [Gemmatimonadota bacterium]
MLKRLLARRGYTLIETVLVLAITGLTITVGVVRLAPALQRAKVKAAANTIAGDFQYAQIMAVRNRTPVAIHITTSTKSYQIRARDDATDIYRTRQLGPGTDFGLQSLAATSSQIILYPNGVALETVTLTPEINGR